MENDTASGNNTFFIDPSLFTCWPPVAQWARIFEFSFLAAVFVLGVPGNFILVLVQAKNPKKSSTDYLVMTMASFEFVCCILNVPIQMLRNLDIIWSVIGVTPLCRFKLFASNYTGLASSLLLAAIAVDRYIKTCKPLNTSYGERQAQYICVGVAFIAAVISSPYGTLSYWNPIAQSCCLYPKPPIFTMKQGGIVLSCLFMLVLCVISASYLSIIISLKRRLADKMRRRNINQPKQAEEKPQNKDDESTLSEGFSAQVTETSNRETSMTSCVDPSVSTVDDVVVENKTSASKTSATEATTKSEAPRQNRHLLMEGKNVNRLTITMLLISLIYISTGILNWVLFFLGPFVLGVEALKLSFSVITINCISNPILFFAMSGRFRENTKKILCRK